MKKLWKDFSLCLDNIRKEKGKPKFHLFQKVILFTFVMLFLGIIVLFLGIIVLTLKSAAVERKRHSYRTDKNYKKVIKEGVFFDTTEYHEQ